MKKNLKNTGGWIGVGTAIGALITFECNGGKLLMDGEFSHLWRLTSDCQ